MTTDVRAHLAPVFPDGYPGVRRLVPLLHSAIRPPSPPKVGRDQRRKVGRDPLLFAMLYLEPYLRDETTGVYSFSEIHLAAYDRMMRWVTPVPDRSAWASHREAGKSVLWFLVAPLWAAAYGIHDYTLMLSDTGGQVKKHLGILKGVIEDGGLLLYDFPHLVKARPWTTSDIRTAGGCRFTAAGMGENILGARDRERRPNLIVGDDLEPGPEDWTPASKAKTLGRLTNDVLRAASPNAAVVLTGTPVATGSIMHDVVRAVRGKPGALEDRGEWVRAKRFDPYHFPAIVDAGTPEERSAWEVRHPIAGLRADRAAMPREFALQMMCDPDDPAAVQWWTDDERTSVFRYDAHFEAVWHILSIDGALTTNSKNDETALAMVGVGPGVGEDREICVEWAVSGHWSRPEIKQHAWDLTRQFSRTCRTWLVDATGRGEEAEAALGAPPAGVTVVPYATVQDSKRYRIETLFDDYARGAVWHRAPLTKLQAQQCAWKPGQTRAAGDDLIDAVRAAKDYALHGDASRAPKRRTR